MTAELESDAQLEIAHVLFIDIVGYSKQLLNEQTALVKRLNNLVRGSDQFRKAEGGGKLITIPTGDGMALVFLTAPDAPVRCAIEINRADLEDPKIALRMGIHSGPIDRLADVNERTNVAGAGINMAQRVMSCGDSGHILLSQHVADDLAQHARWQSQLHPLGEVEVKHGVKIGLVNFYGDDFGNPAAPTKVLQGKKKIRGGQRVRVIAAVLLLLLAAGFWFFSNQIRKPPVALVFPGKSVAVMPFKPLVDSSRDEALETGIADTLITKLSGTREITVPSLSAVQKYEDTKYDAAAIGRALHVNAILEGKVQKAADRIRVMARLIRTSDGSSLWADSVDERFTDVFAVEDAIAQKVATALALRLSEEEQKSLTKHYTQNPEAYQLYLKGRYLWNKYSEEAFRKSIEYFQQALAKDPNYALAYSGMADSYSLLGEMGFMSAKETFPQARTHAEKALALDETLASAHLSLGIVHLFFDWDWPAAGKELERAKQLDPQNAQIYHFYGHYLELTGRPEAGAEETKRGVELDPANLIVNSEVAFGYYLARKPDDALTQVRNTLTLDPTFSYASCIMAWAYELKRSFPDAIEELKRAKPISSDWSWIVGELGYISALQGQRTEAEKAIQELKDRSPKEYIDPGLIAYIYIALGDKDQAFAWLDRAFEERSGLIGWIQIEPKFDPLRSDQRFAELVNRMGLKQ